MGKAEDKGDTLLGTVKWFSGEKGYGFISVDDEPGDLFVHYSDIKGDGFKALDEGARVAFTKASGPKGSRAENVIMFDKQGKPDVSKAIKD